MTAPSANPGTASGFAVFLPWPQDRTNPLSSLCRTAPSPAHAAAHMHTFSCTVLHALCMCTTRLPPSCVQVPFQAPSMGANTPQTRQNTQHPQCADPAPASPRHTTGTYRIPFDSPSHGLQHDTTVTHASCVLLLFRPTPKRVILPTFVLISRLTCVPRTRHYAH